MLTSSMGKFKSRYRQRRVDDLGAYGIEMVSLGLNVLGLRLAYVSRVHKGDVTVRGVRKALGGDHDR